MSSRIRIHSSLTKLRPVRASRAIAQFGRFVSEEIEYRKATIPLFAIVTGLLGLAVLAELIYALVVIS